jgi:hypothetical protein
MCILLVCPRDASKEAVFNGEKGSIGLMFKSERGLEGFTSGADDSGESVKMSSNAVIKGKRHRRDCSVQVNQKKTPLCLSFERRTLWV